MYTPAPDLAELAAAGLTEADLEADAVEVWPEHFDLFHLFTSLQTQWRVGMGGPTGLDYNVLYHKLDRMNLEPDEYAQFEHDIQVMEHAALTTMNRKE